MHVQKRVYSQFCIETIHDRQKRNWEFNGLFVRVSTFTSLVYMSSMIMIAVLRRDHE